MSPSSKPPFVAVVKPNYISITLAKTNKTFAISDSHPHFKKFAAVLKAKDWRKVPGMIDLAEALSNIKSGLISLDKGVIKYKGDVIDDSLAKRIREIHQSGNDVKYMLRFMNNLYLNPDARARHELYDFLNRCDLPITDDGCFIAYKAVREDYKDCHTGTLDNSVGQVVEMSRKHVDPVRSHECSNGLHFCSRGYLASFGGAKVMAVKINPKDVVSVPTDYGYTKGRCSKYEVIKELGMKDDKINKNGHAMLEEEVLIPVRAERASLLKKILENPSVKRAIRAKKMSKATILKASSTRLQVLADKFEIMTTKAKVKEPSVSRLFLNTLAQARKAAKVTREKLASEMDVTVKTIIKLEGKELPTTDEESNYLAALATVTGQQDPKKGGISFPAPSGLLKAYGRKEEVLA